ncbi:unnamed protein product [Caenorhabditis angaria]|uniref:C2H2-type domain-containing protein n=1 Tax=Caenorhabditis angaria TaxID=860376 RepID=A0A9P1I754_9PELO|nr:unnamed protein product [Caenorhabditis angaria]
MLGYPIVFRCCECTVEEPNLENLESHIWSRHFRKFPYNCSICDFPAINSSSLQDHFSHLHPEVEFVDFKRNLEDEKRLRQMVAESIAVLVETQDNTCTSAASSGAQTVGEPRVFRTARKALPQAVFVEEVATNSDEDDFGLLEDDENVDLDEDCEEEEVVGGYVDNMGNAIFMGGNFMEEEEEEEDEDEQIGTGNSFHLKLLRQRRLEKTINDVASEGAMSIPSTSRTIMQSSTEPQGSQTSPNKQSAPGKSSKSARLQCEMCGKNFKFASKLNEHRRSHLGERPFKCDFCPAEFTQKGALNVHSRLHTGERPYMCQWECGRSFVSSSARKLHEKTHSGERSFACTICMKTFTKNSHCLRHFRNIHGRVLAVAAENSYEIANSAAGGTLEITMNVMSNEDVVLGDEKYRCLVNDVIDSVRGEKYIRNCEEEVVELEEE